MAKSLSTDWETQLRQIGRTQFRTAKQIRTWLGRLDLASPATRPRTPAPGDTAPGVDPIQYDIRKLRALDHINQITVAEKLAPPTFTFMEFRHPTTRQPTYQCQIEWQGRTQTGLVQNSKKLAKHSAAVEMIDQLSRDGILSITARS